MWVYLFAIPIMGHGMAHLSGVFAPWTKSAQGFGSGSWLFSSGVSLTSTVGRLWSVIWLAAAACLVYSAISLLVHKPIWSTVALVGVLLSIAAIAPWWRVVPPGAKAGLALDVILLAMLLTPLRSLVERIL